MDETLSPRAPGVPVHSFSPVDANKDLWKRAWLAYTHRQLHGEVARFFRRAAASTVEELEWPKNVDSGTMCALLWAHIDSPLKDEAWADPAAPSAPMASLADSLAASVEFHNDATTALYAARHLEHSLRHNAAHTLVHDLQHPRVNGDGQWTTRETAILLELVEEHTHSKRIKWLDLRNSLPHKLPNRTLKACRQLVQRQRQER